jgi:aspartyl protease family protein
MLRMLVLAGIVAGISASVPILLQNGPGGGVAAPPVPAAAAPAAKTPSGRKVRLDADARGHFSADFKLNGRPVPAMVDTGASAVALNLSTARRIGLSLAPSDFTGIVETANGRVKAAGVVIDRIAIGRVEFADVPAVVLEDRALSGTLIGMSFLSRLKRFQVEGGALVLEQ